MPEEEAVQEDGGSGNAPAEAPSEERPAVRLQAEAAEDDEEVPEEPVDDEEGEEEEEEEEEYEDPAGIAGSTYYISAPSGDTDAYAVYYLTDQLVRFKDISQIRKTAANDIYGASAYVLSSSSSSIS